MVSFYILTAVAVTVLKMALSQMLTFSVHFNFEINRKTPSGAVVLNPVAY